MLTITVPGTESFSDKDQEFLVEADSVLELEHSLVSLSKWEERFEKPFITEIPHSTEETMYYIECMYLGEKFPGGVFDRMTQENLDDINAYLNKKMTATWFNEGQSKRNREIITAELIYYWMITAGIPMECERWHLNKLFTLLKVFSRKNEKPKRMTSAEAARQRADLNAKRKAQMGTSG